MFLIESIPLGQADHFLNYLIYLIYFAHGPEVSAALGKSNLFGDCSHAALNGRCLNKAEAIHEGA